ncbi:hypothetical protein JCM3765_004889 [Sporobolomyces pararoseus]
MQLSILTSIAVYLAHAGLVLSQESTWSDSGATDIGSITSLATPTSETAPTSTGSATWESSSSSASTTNSSATPSPTGLVAGKNQVIVAPKQGDLRMVPFNINVPENETITFIFGAGPHTVTQSSLLTICNASDVEGAFKSGMQDVGFEFPVKVTTNKTQSYYCGVPNHCQKGMFGLINGLTVAVPGDSFDDTIPKMTAK